MREREGGQSGKYRYALKTVRYKTMRYKKSLLLKLEENGKEGWGLERVRQMQPSSWNCVPETCSLHANRTFLKCKTKYPSVKGSLLRTVLYGET